MTESTMAQQEQSTGKPFPGIWGRVFPRPEYPRPLGPAFAIVNTIANWLFWIDLIPLIADALDVLNPARFCSYLVLDTVTSILLLAALGLKVLLQWKHPEAGAEPLRPWEIAVTFIASLPLPLILIAVPQLPEGAALARLVRLLPRALKLTRLLMRLADVSDNLIFVGSVVGVMWFLVVGLVPTSQLRIMGGLSLSIALFALVYEIRPKTTQLSLFKTLKKNIGHKIKELREDLISVMGIIDSMSIDGGQNTHEEFVNLVSQLTDFGAREVGDIEIGHIEKAGQCLYRLRKLIKRYPLSQKGSNRHPVSNSAAKIEQDLLCLYNETRKIIRADLLANLIDLVLHLLFFGLLFFVVSKVLDWLRLLPPYLLDAGKIQIVLAHINVWLVTIDPKVLLFMGVVGILIFYFVLRHAVRLFTERTETALDDLAGAFVPLPVTAILLLDLVKATFPRLLESLTISTAGINLLSLLIWTWVAVGLFNGVVVFALKRQAAKTESPYDDIVAKLIQRFGIIVIVGIVLLVTLPRIEWSSQGILATLLATVVGTVLLYIGRDFAENFFAGIYIVATRPFQEHDRIQLSSGDICDVRELGLTGTRLYKVSDNTEIVMPNTIIAREGVTNLSRPDMMLRLQTVVYLDIRASIKDAEGVLLAIVWDEPEVAKLQIDGPGGVLRLVEDIGARHPTLKDLYDDVKERLRGAKQLQDSLDSNLQSSQEIDEDKVKTLLELSQKIDESKIKTLAMLEQRLEVARPAIQGLVLALSRHPIVTSEFEVTEEGKGYIKLTILFFITHIERIREILGKLHSRIQVEFERHGIDMLIPSKSSK